MHKRKDATTILVGKKRHKLRLNRQDANRLELLIESEGGWLSVTGKGYVEYCKDISVGGRTSRKRTSKRIRLHKLVAKWARILRLPTLDHHNGNKLDCRRNNLRRATMSQQNQNRPATCISGFKGVYPRRGGFRAVCNGEHIGDFSTAKEAALAYDTRAKRQFGRFARLNFPSHI